MGLGLAIAHGDWGACELQIDGTSGEGSATWYGSTATDGARDIVEIATAIVAWANAAARPWYGVRTFTLSWTGTGPKLAPTITCDAEMDWTPNALLTTYTTWAVSGSTMTLSSTGALGSVYGDTGVLLAAVTAPRDSGIVTRTGGTSREPWHAAGRSPTIEALCTESQATALCEALEIATFPRTARAYEAQTATWRAIALGSVVLSRSFDLYRVTIGGAL